MTRAESDRTEAGRVGDLEPGEAVAPNTPSRRLGWRKWDEAEPTGADVCDIADSRGASSVSEPTILRGID